MTVSDYYQLLGLPAGASIDDIKRAYRQKARMYHPDLNHSPDAKDKFILATEAYEFLVANLEKLTSDDESYQEAMEYWRKYRMSRSRRRANAYARASYINFKRTKFYQTTRIFDATTIILGLLFSIVMIIMTIAGYIIRIHDPIPGFNPLFTLILLIFLGLVFLILSVVFLKVFIETSAKHRKKKTVYGQGTQSAG